SPWLRRVGLPDLDARAELLRDARSHHDSSSIYLLGFFWTASSLLEELGRRLPQLIAEVAVVDFNPHVNEELRRRGVRVIYGDISQRQTLMHAGVDQAKVIVCTIPNALLKGTTNIRLVQLLREINPTARLLVHSENFADIPRL